MRPTHHNDPDPNWTSAKGRGCVKTLGSILGSGWVAAFEIRDGGGLTGKTRRSGLDRFHQRPDSDDLHRPFQVVGQNVQAHLGTDAWQRLGEEVRRTHPRFERAEGVFDGLSAQA